jgi:hypothetical protein
LGDVERIDAGGAPGEGTREPDDLVSEKLHGAKGEVRELWLTELTVLRARGVVAGEPTGLMGPNGYVNVAFDVTACAQFLRANWAAIEGKTLITLAEIEEAEKIADYVAAMAKLRLEAGDAKQRAQVLRNKAFTLFLESYEVARRAAMAIRWDEGDAESFAPSIYSGRYKKRELRAATEAGEGSAPQPTDASAVASVVGGSNGSSNGASNGAPNVPASPVLPSQRFEE